MIDVSLSDLLPSQTQYPPGKSATLECWINDRSIAVIDSARCCIDQR
jgi:hypothetical protein